MSHTYTGISNKPLDRQRIFYPWCYWDNAFTDEELKMMCEYFDSQGLERGTTVKSHSENAPNEDVRVSNVKFHYVNENTSWMFAKLNYVIDQLNLQYYNFDLNGYDSFQYTEYEGTELGKYDFHMDTIMGDKMPNDMYETRKLSLTMCLNEPGVDFEGGDFQVCTGQEKDAETVTLKKGRIIVFPSFIVHRVSPVTKGKRKSLVIWVTGPKFK